MCGCGGGNRLCTNSLRFSPRVSPGIGYRRKTAALLPKRGKLQPPVVRNQWAWAGRNTTYHRWLRFTFYKPGTAKSTSSAQAGSFSYLFVVFRFLFLQDALHILEKLVVCITRTSAAAGDRRLIYYGSSKISCCFHYQQAA